LQCGERRLIITDHTKFERSALVKVCDFRDFDTLVTDSAPPPAIAEQLTIAGVQTEIATDTRTGSNKEKKPERIN